MMTVGELVAYLKLDDSQFNRGLDKGQQNLGQVGRKMAGVGQKMTMGITLPLLAVAAGSVMASAKFETSMNQVQAASGASAGELADLTQYAKDMGAATVFSAGEAAGAMLELSKSGFTPAQIQGGALKATMDLAAAGGLELADAATITSNAMNTFGLQAKDAGSIAAALAGGANASSASVEDMALALGQVGPGAKTAGLSMQDTAAVLAEFSDKGIRGSDAGTSLKTMLTNLVPSTLKAQKVFKDLGIDFTNADGSFKSISDMAQILKDRMGGLSAEQRTLAMETMFGSDATRAATVLMQGGAEGLKKYTDATNDQSAATDMAKARMKGLGGALENMKGSLETAGIAIGDVLAPGIRVAAGAIKALADGLSAMPKGAQYAVVGFGTILAAAGPVLLITGKILTALSAIQKFRMGKQVLGGVTDVLGKGGGVAGNVPLQTALGLNTTATEANTLALGGKGLLPGGGGGPGKTAVDVAEKGGPLAAATTVGMLAGLALIPAAAGGANYAAGYREQRVGKGSSVTNVATDPFADNRMGSYYKRWHTQASAMELDGERLASSMRASGDKAGAGLAAGLAHGVGPALQSIQKVRSSAGRDIHMGHLDATQMINEIARVSRALGGVSSAARTAGNAAANAIKSPSGGGGSYRGHFMAAGGDFMVNKPTLFVAGEAGPERATFTPKGKEHPGNGGQSAGAGGDTVFNFYVDKVVGTDERAARQFWNMVKPIAMSEMRLKGAMSRG